MGESFGICRHNSRQFSIYNKRILVPSLFFSFSRGPPSLTAQQSAQSSNVWEKKGGPTLSGGSCQIGTTLHHQISCVSFFLTTPPSWRAAATWFLFFFLQENVSSLYMSWLVRLSAAAHLPCGRSAIDPQVSSPHTHTRKSHFSRTYTHNII